MTYVSERKAVRRIYVPVREGEQWRIRSNQELEEILRGEDIVKFVKSRRLAWLRHVEWMDEERLSRKLLHGRMEGRRRRGRPRKRWLHNLEDLRVMQVGRRWEKVRSKEEWRRIVREAKAHPGL
jgi:SOS response regulatory protein OraA/RecX